MIATGIGFASAAAAAEAALERHSLAAALAVGLCGAAAPALEVGDVLVYGSVRRAGEPPIVLDPQLASEVASRLPDALTGLRGLSVDAVISSAARKRELFQSEGVDAVDMESFAIAKCLRAAGVRVAVVRVASDGPNDDLPDLSRAVGDDGKLDGARLAVAMFGRPRAAGRMSLGSLRALHAIERCVALTFA